MEYFDAVTISYTSEIITPTNVDQVIWCHMAPLSHNELNYLSDVLGKEKYVSAIHTIS